MESSRRRRSIWWKLWKYFVVNTFDTRLLSPVITGIDHGRSRVMATTPWWFVVRRGRPSSCALGKTRRRTTNHSGVTARTPFRPWSILRISLPWKNMKCVKRLVQLTCCTYSNYVGSGPILQYISLIFIPKQVLPMKCYHGSVLIRVDFAVPTSTFLGGFLCFIAFVLLVFPSPRRSSVEWERSYSI